MYRHIAITDKESANCRLEANYAHQQEVYTIHLMVLQNYKAKGSEPPGVGHRAAGLRIHHPARGAPADAELKRGTSRILKSARVAGQQIKIN
jgi:hypothetical protein